MRGLAETVAAIPGLVRLRQGVRTAEEGGASAVLALARSFLEDDGSIRTLVAAAIAGAAADPFCRPPFRASRNAVQDGLLLFSDPVLTIQAAVLEADRFAIQRTTGEPPPPIAFSGQRSLFRFVAARGARLSIWSAPAIGADFTASAGTRCRLSGTRELADGDIVEFDGRCESFVVESVASDLVYLFASTPLGSAPVGVEYDAASLEPVAASSTDEAGSRSQMMLALLRTMGRADAAPLFAEALSTPHFHTRWQAMREFLALDAGLALPHLERMAAADPHPEVRAAAAATLEHFFPARILPLAPCPC
jgi:hypothetical protein